MKKGFTLIELLAVIVVLAIIATITTPIVLNIVNNGKKSTYQSSIDLYGKSVKQAVLNYELDKKVTPKTFEQIKSYLEFEGNKVECSTKIIYDDGEIYLKDCSVDGNLVEDYSYGKATLSDTILKHATENKYYYTTKPDFTKAPEDGEYGLYVAAEDEDNLIYSYYFRGDVENNYVKFGSYQTGESLTLKDQFEITFEEETPMYWRIVRVNGDGTVRLIYDGIEKISNGTPHTAIIGESSYNDNDNATMGYTFGAEDNQVDSVIKVKIEEWYSLYLEKKYEMYIADTIFCNDKSTVEDNLYSAYSRLNNSNSNPDPTLACSKNDSYTVENDIGNNNLNKPVGLLTADEAFLAGTGQNSYIYSGKSFWTLTPAEDEQHVYIINPVENIFLDSKAIIDETDNVRPVINLNIDVRFTGTGTIDDPYVIVTD